eukprot:scaffold5668_cov111-Isochrysis_galbana.AAC.5
MRQDTLLSSGGLASPPFPPLPLPFPPARDLLSQALGGGTGVALGVGWGGVGCLYLREGGGRRARGLAPISPYPQGRTPRGVCACDLLELVPLPGSIRCVVGECVRSYSVRWSWSVSEKRSSASSSSVARGDSLARCALRDGGGSPLLVARSCFVRASCASASARSANRLRNGLGLWTLLRARFELRAKLERVGFTSPAAAVVAAARHQAM